MRIAVSSFRDIVAAVFDFADEITVFDVERGNILRSSVHSIQGPQLPLCTSKLGELKVKSLLCGSISNTAVILLQHHGIEIIPGITGKTDAVINKFLNGSLDSPKNHLPGFSFQGKRSKYGRHRRRRLGRKDGCD